MGYEEYEVASSQEQRIALILIQFLPDPYLVSYFLKILRSVTLEGSRDFHLSLRNNMRGVIAQSRLKGLPKREAAEYIASFGLPTRIVSVNSSGEKIERDIDPIPMSCPGVPSNCDIVVDGKGWRDMKLLIKTINYTHDGFFKVSGSVLSTHPDQHPNSDFDPDAYYEIRDISSRKYGRLYWINKIIDVYTKDTMDFRKWTEQSYQHFRAILDKYPTMVDVSAEDYYSIYTVCMERSDIADGNGEYPFVLTGITALS